MIRMMQTLALVAILVASATAAQAQSYSEPARGTELRADLMSAIRPHIEWALGAPIEFVVNDLRVSGDLAFASLWAQRPGGGAIDIASTPAAQRDQLDASFGDTPRIQVLYRKSGRVWVAVEHTISATDLWYSWEPICAIWRPVIPDACNF